MDKQLTGLEVPPKIIHAQGSPKLFFWGGGTIVEMFYGLETACFKMLVPGGWYFCNKTVRFLWKNIFGVK